MTDLIERLRAADEYFCGRDHEVFADAADEIVNLRTALHLIVNAESCLLADAQAIAKNALENARP